MVTVDVCMETVFDDVPFLDRPARIAEAGFKVVELWFPELHLEGRDCSRLRAASSPLTRLASSTWHSPTCSRAAS